MSGWWSWKSCYGRTHIWLYIFICSSVEESAQSGKFSGNLAHDFIPCVLHLFVSVYASPPSPLPGATLERDTICLQTPHRAHAGAALTSHFLPIPCLWHINCTVLYCTMCTVLYCNVCTHVDPHALDREHPDWRPLVRHEPVKLVPTLITQNSTSNFKWNHIVPRWNYVVPNWNYIGPTWNYMVPPRKKKLGFFNFWGWKKLLAYFCDDECEIGFLKILF